MADIFDEIFIEESPQEDIFDQIQTDTASPLGELGRHVARSGSRVSESLLGLPGDVLRVGQIGAQQLEKGASKVREKLGLEPLDSGIKKPGIPGSSELKDLSVKIFGEKVLPQSKTESFIDDIVSDAAVLAVPVKGKIPFMRSIGTALAGNLAFKGAEKVGLDEKGQAAAKLGAFFLSGLAGKGNVKKYWSEQYKLAENAVPTGAQVETFALERKLDNLSHDLSKGISTPSKEFVKTPLKNIRKKIKTGKISVDELVEIKRNINEHRGKLYKDLTGKQSINYAQGKINDLSGLVDSEIAKYGKTNATFLNHYKNANEAFAGFNQSKRVGNWLGRQIKLIGKGPLLILEGLFPKLLPGTVASFVGLKGGELVTRVLRNPTLRNYYGNLVKDAVKENTAGFIKNLRALEKGIKKSDPELYKELAGQKQANDDS